MSGGAIEPSGRPYATVVVCTRNRAARLQGTLEGLAGQGDVGAPWEVLVVDNGSTDRTAKVVAEHGRGLSLRYLREPSLGLSHARNRAIDEAAGEVIIWIDDDVQLPGGWLSAWIEGVRTHPGAAFFGAGIRVAFDVPPPPWIEACWPRFAPLFAERVVPRAGDAVDAAYLPFGANYAVRTSVQRTLRYDPELGRRGVRVSGGEETTLLATLLERGHEGRWIGGAELHHVMGPERVSLSRLHAQIRANARILGSAPRGSDRLVLGAGALWWRWVSNEVLWRSFRWTRPPDTWVHRFFEAAVARGHLDRTIGGEGSSRAQP